MTIQTTRLLDMADSRSFRGSGAGVRRVYGLQPVSGLPQGLLRWSKVGKARYFINVGFFEGTFIAGSNAILETIENGVLLLKVIAAFAIDTVTGESEIPFTYRTGQYGVKSAELMMVSADNIPSEVETFEQSLQYRELGRTDASGEFSSVQGPIIHHLRFDTNFNI